MKKSLLGILVTVLLFSPALYKTLQAAPELEQDDRSGWFLGSDQGVMFFVGDSSDLINLQYYGSLFGGYNIKGYFQPMLRIGQAIGNANTFFNPTTFFFMMEGGFRATPLRTKVRPFFVGTAGFYVLSFDDFTSTVFSDVNFTFAGGGGLEVQFGHSVISLGSEFRGFINDGDDLKAVTVTLGYVFQF